MDIPVSDYGQRVVGIVAAMLRELRPASPPPPVHLDAAIEHDLGLDSLSRVELVSRIEHAFDVTLPDGLATGAATLRELADAVAHAPTRGPAAVSPAIAPAPQPVAGLPGEANTLLEAFAWHVERHPAREHVTVLEGDDVVDSISYAALWTRAAAVARGLHARGIAPGDAVAMMLPTGSAFFEAFLGAMQAGAVPVPLYPPLRWSEIGAHVRGRAAILANAQARLLVTVDEARFIGGVMRADVPELPDVVTVEELRVPGAAPAPHAASPRALALLQYTSGSTGDPKGVTLAHDNLLANIRTMGRAAAATSTDRFLSWLPLYHDMGLIGAWLATMYHGIPLVIMPPTAFLARPARWLRMIHRFGATMSAGPNFAYEIAATKVRDDEIEGVDLATWRLAFNGAEPVRAATIERFAQRFARFGFDRRALTPVYGLAESAVGLTFPPLGRGPRIARVDARALADEGVARDAQGAAPAVDVVACGVPLIGHEVRIVDERGRELPARREGRIEFRGPSATRGYFRNPQATAKLSRAGWLDTGDVGFVEAGEIFVTSRIKDLIKRGGHNLHPYDLEAAVGELAGVRKGCVAVFGMPDRATGSERVIVVAETNEKADAARAALRDRIQALAAIHLDGPADEILLVPARTVQKTSSGKIRRAACRDLYEKRLLGAPPRAVWLQLAALAVEAAAARLRRFFRALAGAAYGMYALLVFGVLACLGAVTLAVVPRAQARYRVAHAAAILLMRALRLPLHIEGASRATPESAAILVSNHASYTDAIVLVAALPRPVHFVAKREFARIPVLGWLFRRMGAHFVERSDAAQGVEDTHEMAAAVGRGETIVMFPEGMFTREPGLRPFRLGAFVVSAQTRTPVIPIVLQGTRSLLRANRWLLERYPVAVDVLAPMAPDGEDWSAAVRLRERVRAAMLARSSEQDLAQL